MNTHLTTYITTHSYVAHAHTCMYIGTYTSTIVWVWWRDHQIMLIALSAHPTTTRQLCFSCWSFFFIVTVAYFSDYDSHSVLTYEVTCTQTHIKTNVKFICGGVTCFVITVSINTLRRSAQRPTADARTVTHCQSHTDTHPHVLTKNCKTDCEKCRMRWVGLIGGAKSILDFLYSMRCVCVCILCIPFTHEPHLPARPTIEV